MRQNQDPFPNSCVKAEYGIPSKGMGTNKITHALGIDSGLPANSHSDRPSYTTVSHMQRAMMFLRREDFTGVKRVLCVPITTSDILHYCITR